jgi:hypothetical protein
VVPVAAGGGESALGRRLVGLIERGGLKDDGAGHPPPGTRSRVAVGAVETRLFWRQLEAVGYEVRPGPGKLLVWGVAGYPQGGWRGCTMTWC